MSQSMTGFARTLTENSQLSITWECRSVNHRYLEMQFRIPEALRGIEHELRELVRQHLKRGKVDLVLRYDFKAQADSELNLNTNLVQQLFHLQGTLQQHQSTLKELTTADILRFPGVLKEPELEQDSLLSLSKEGLKECLAKLVDARKSEGERVASFIQERVDQVSVHVDALRTFMPQMRERLKQKTLTRLEELQSKPDTDRLEQELVYLAQKMDVDEELDRLESHVTELKKTLEKGVKGNAIGRRMDFLMQEFNREANTLASKSHHADTTQHAVELKVLIEQMREQIQNLE